MCHVSMKRRVDDVYIGERLCAARVLSLAGSIVCVFGHPAFGSTADPHFLIPPPAINATPTRGCVTLNPHVYI